MTIMTNDSVMICMGEKLENNVNESILYIIIYNNIQYELFCKFFYGTGVLGSVLSFVIIVMI